MHSLSFSTADIEKASERYSEILKTYDKRVRPSANEKPVDVQLQIEIFALGPVEEKSFVSYRTPQNDKYQTYNVDMYFRNWWNDPRLQLSVGNLTFNGNPEEIWSPDLYIQNAHSVRLHKSTSETMRTRINQDGGVYTSAKLSAVCSCNMDLHSYPMDKQVCTMIIESYSFSTKDMELGWKPDKSVSLAEAQVEGYKITKVWPSTHVLNYGTIGESFTNLKISFALERTFSYYLFRSYIPSTFLVVLTWGSFWLPMATYPARCGLIVTNFLASAFILQGASANIPRVPYTTAIEIFLLINIMFILATMLEYIAVIQSSQWKIFNCFKFFQKEKITSIELEQRDSNKRNDETKFEIKSEVHIIDRISRITFPLSYFICLIIYFSYFFG